MEHFLGRLDLSIYLSISLDAYQLLQCRIHFSPSREENRGFYGIFQIFPEIYPSQANSETKKTHPVNSSTQAKLEQQV